VRVSELEIPMGALKANDAELGDLLIQRLALHIEACPRAPNAPIRTIRTEIRRVRRSRT